jgi:hypothetical protein
MARLTLAAADGSNADGLLPILEIGNKPLVMRWVTSAMIERVGDRRPGGDVYLGTGCLDSRSGYRDAG